MDGDTATTTSTPEADVANLFAASRHPAPESDTAEPTAEAVVEVPEVVESEEVETEATEEAPAAKLKFKLDDEEFDEDTLREWKKSGLRQSDYTRKTTEHSEVVKSFESEKATFNETKAAQLKQLEDAIKAVTPQEPDWQKARQEMTADQYLQLRADWDAHHQQMKVLRDERAKVEADVQAEQGKKASARAEQNVARVMELLPDWKDEGKRQAQFADIKRLVLDPLGVPEGEVLGAGRPELFRILHEAAEYRKLVQTKNLPPVKQAVASKVITPGTPNAKPKATAVETAARRLAQTGSEKDMAALFKSYRTG